MSYTPASYTGDGATVAYSVPFPYLEQAHVIVRVAGAIQSSGYSFTSPSTITFDTAPASAAAIEITRSTPINALLAIISGQSVFKSSETNLVRTQLLYIMQEIAYTGNVLQASISSVQDIDVNVSATEANLTALLAALETEYDLNVFLPIPVLANAVAFDFVVPRAMRIVAGATGSLAEAGSAPTAAIQTYSIRKNGVEVGTITYAIGSTTGVFTLASEVTFAAGDNLTVVPTTVDDDFTTATFTIRLRR